MGIQTRRVADVTARRDAIRSFVDAAGWGNSASVLVAGDASNRKYERLTKPDGKTAILMDAPPEKGEDVTAFVTIARHLTGHGFSAPAIFEQDALAGFLLIEDLGDDLFARLMNRDIKWELPLYEAATDVLISLHRAPLLPLDICDADWLTDMTAPAFEWYAQADSASLMDNFTAQFRPLAALLDAVSKVVILRDYHAENLLWLPKRDGIARVGILDFQDALLGHPAYDLVSVLQDARRDVDPMIERAMINRYVVETGVDAEAFRSAYAILGAQRNLRIIGIFARLCLRDGKAHYVDMIPRVWRYAMRNLQNPALANVATFINDCLPPPTPEFLEHLKSQCTTHPTL
ncbi:MAG: phosphotransferase [Sulfitobacter sp.]